MSLETRSNVSELEARGGLDTELTDGAGEDISGGVSTTLVRSADQSLYLEADGAVDVHVYFSPFEDGAKKTEPEESPISFSGAGRKLVQIDYNASYIELVGSDTTPVWGGISEVV